MMRFQSKKLRSFLRDESGATYLLPFVVWLPLFLTVIIAGLEVGALSIRHTQLERGLDLTVREVRLGTGENLSHDTLKTMICDNAILLADCDKMLRLEMIPLDLRNWTEPTRDADCVDKPDEVRPLRQFDPGQPNELMMLRACFKYKPITPAGALAQSMPKDDQGYTAIVSFAAFVQEPY
ncbi:pilus assembly protein [uncultured Marivita sp.]|uniref:TadE/TadG family type IV pilus assembly protein n=1 Tax=uncultured Marivita sp. TaxID=888080 RepID=UPI00260F7976|nr:pilus assembly protein [uncultured Marivita sp.]